MLKKIRRFIERKLGIFGKAFYYLRTHTISKYHVINLSKTDNGTSPYRWGWCDRTHLMLLANFQILVDFMEKEVFVTNHSGGHNYGTTLNPEEVWPGGQHNDEYAFEQLKTEKQIRDLYDWWKYVRPIEYSNLDKLGNYWMKHEKMVFTPIPSENASTLSFSYENEEIKIKVEANRDAYTKESERLDKQDQDKLEELVKLRNYLWT